MEFHDLEVFVAVTREKSFSRAAQRIYRTQPAVSLAIRRLEEELEGSLFDRASKEPVLTDLGHLLYRYAEELLNIRAQVLPAVQALKNIKRGRIRVGANEIGAIYLVSHIIAYRKIYPDVKIEVIRMRSRDIPYEIINRNLDLGIVSYVASESQLVSQEVFEDRLSLIVYPSHRFAKRRKVAFRDLQDEVFAAHFVKASFRDQIIELFHKENIPLQTEVELPTIEAIKKYVKMEEAIALIPRMCVETELNNQEFYEVHVPELAHLSRTLRITHLEGKGSSHAARAFIEMLTKNGKQKQTERLKKARKTAKKKSKP